MCNKTGYELCVNISDIDKFITKVIGQTHKAIHQVNCNNKCLTYLLTCHHCKKNYVRETIGTFNHRWKNYKAKTLYVTIYTYLNVSKLKSKRLS